jgi:hypothetical protein
MGRHSEDLRNRFVVPGEEVFCVQAIIDDDDLNVVAGLGSAPSAAPRGTAKADCASR